VASKYESGLKGSECGQAKLNETLVARIRRQHARKERLKRLLDAAYSTQAFAQRYGVSPNTITKALTFATWRHVR
jgi:prolyl-tRNA editing enzyme YbaK/EbsC (Cys-tRNA(Pro) deacylase)